MKNQLKMHLRISLLRTLLRRSLAGDGSDDTDGSDSSDNEAGEDSSNPLPRTGAQIGVALGVGVALLAAGAVISVATRRKN